MGPKGAIGTYDYESMADCMLVFGCFASKMLQKIMRYFNPSIHEGPPKTKTYLVLGGSGTQPEHA